MSEPRPEIFYAQLVGQVVRGRRELSGISMQTMATGQSVSASGWSRVETGETSMSLTQLRQAARQLGTEPAALVREADAMAAQLKANGVMVYDARRPGSPPLGSSALLTLLSRGESKQ